MLKKQLALTFVMCAGLFATQKADAGTVMCHGCTDQQIEAEAWNRISQIASTGPMYIVALDRGVVRRYIYRNNITPEWNPEFDPFEAWVEETPVEPQLVAAILNIKQEIVAMKAQGRDVLQVPADPGLPVTGYEAIINVTREQALINYIAEHNKWGTLLQEALEGLDIPFFNESYVWNPQPIVLANGDTAIYIYNNQTNRWERQPDSYRDKSGNIIPETKQDIYGDGYREYDFVNNGDAAILESMANLENYARLNGIPVHDMTYGALITAGGTYVVTCTETMCSVWYIQ